MILSIDIITLTGFRIGSYVINICDVICLTMEYGMVCSCIVALRDKTKACTSWGMEFVVCIKQLLDLCMWGDAEIAAFDKWIGDRISFSKNECSYRWFAWREPTLDLHKIRLKPIILQVAWKELLVIIYQLSVHLRVSLY